MVKNPKTLILLVLSVSLVAGAVLMGGCVGKEVETPPQQTPTQIIEDITPREAFALMQSNPDVIIIDVRTPEAFAREHIEGAINMDFHSDTFQDEIEKLDKSKTYIVYCSCPGSRGISGSTVDMMAELNFEAAYNIYSIYGGTTGWAAEGFPTTQQTPTEATRDITPQEAFTLIQQNQENPDFVIIDVRTSEHFANGHIEGAINMDYRSETFADELDELDKDKTYLIYGRKGSHSEEALAIMEELNFREVYNMAGGINQWQVEGLPTLMETSNQIIRSITPQEAFALFQENRNNPDFVIIDVRTSEHFANGRVEGAINIDYRSETFEGELDKLDKDKTYLIYYSCHCGQIDTKVLRLMQELNFKEVYNISGGLDRWEIEGFPTTQ